MDERSWIDENAHVLTATTPDEPLTDLEPLAEMVGAAEVVGLGESTRAGHEVMVLAHRVLRVLVQHKGFRTLAIQDDSSAVAALDEHLRTGAGDLRTLLADLWHPWQNTEFHAVLTWLRGFNERHPDDVVGLVGLAPRGPRLAHYDEVAEHVRGVAPQRVDELLAHYNTIRTAHTIGEHVQLARDIHPGRPFAEHAADAARLVRALPDYHAGHSHAVELAELIARFHATSVAAGHDFDAAAEAAAAALLAEHDATGRKIVYWEGFAHTANATAGGINAMGVRLNSVGARLRSRLGDRYLSMVIGFGSGAIHGVEVPEPPADFTDAVLNSASAPRYLLDLRAPRDAAVATWLRGPHKLRVIAGIYDPARDHDHFIAAGALDEWFDLVLRVRTITPTTLLGGTVGAGWKTG